MESINRTDKIWMASMELCRRFSGCHQMPERSFFIGRYQFPLWARCTGIVIGHMVGIIASIRKTVPFLCTALMLPLMIDGIIQEKTTYESTNLKRVITGILYGFGVMSAFIHLIRKIASFLTER